MIIEVARSLTQLQACFEVIQVLRPHLDQDQYLQQVQRQQTQGYHLMSLTHEQQLVSILGYRVVEYLAWGKILYIDDLATLRSVRGQGFAGALLDWVESEAQRRDCQQIHLDSGPSRHDAHRLYLKQGFILSSHHLSKRL